MPPSAMFYGDTLQPCAKNGMVVWSGLTAPHLPVKFIGHNDPEATKDEARANNSYTVCMVLTHHL